MVLVTGFIPKKSPDEKRLTVVGNIVEDPDLLFSNSGIPYSRFRLAANFGKDDQRKASFYNVVCFNTLAENVAESLHKGNRVVVYGIYEAEEYEKDGKKGTNNKIVANEVAVSLMWKTVSIVDIERRDANAAAMVSEIFEEDPF